MDRLTQLHGGYPVAGITVDLTLTGGAVTTAGANAAILLRRAAAALAAAKADARPWYAWTAAMDRAHRDELQLQADLRAALTRDELLLHYQPQVARGSHRITGVEALVRWRHPTRGLLAPGVFLPAAEQGPLIDQVTDFVLAEATRQGAAWAARGTPVTVSVNLSARSLTDHALPARIAAHLAAAGLAPHLLTVEITETAPWLNPSKPSSC